ncbi:MAG TPA: hypothetical protein VH196_04770 [Terriglobales bacterium]|nr:hypothetical protein [Terriglobales bacterium]
MAYLADSELWGAAGGIGGRLRGLIPVTFGINTRGKRPVAEGQKNEGKGLKNDTTRADFYPQRVAGMLLGLA